MATRKTLSNAQTLILSHATAHPDHNLFPLPTGFRARGAVRQKVLAALLKQGFVSERRTTDDSTVWRRDSRRHRLTLVMTTQGGQAIGLSVDAARVPKLGPVTAVQPLDLTGDGDDGTTSDRCASIAAGTSASASDVVDSAGSGAGRAGDGPSPVIVAPGGKLGSVLAVLASEDGATLAALVTLTGWLPHTTRAALCRLRQRGYPIRLVGEASRRAYRLDRPVRALDIPTPALPTGG